MAAVPAVLQNALGVRTWGDVRAMIHSGGPAISSLLVGWNVVDDNKASLIAGLLVALASPLAAYPEAENNFRKWLYGVVAAVQAVLIGVVGVVDSPIVDLLGSALAILGGMVASANTPTSESGFVATSSNAVTSTDAHNASQTRRIQQPVSVDTSSVRAATKTANIPNTGWRGL
jgi:hypothetical protein